MARDGFVFGLRDRAWKKVMQIMRETKNRHTMLGLQVIKRTVDMELEGKLEHLSIT